MLYVDKWLTKRFIDDLVFEVDLIQKKVVYVHTPNGTFGVHPGVPTTWNGPIYYHLKRFTSIPEEILCIEDGVAFEAALDAWRKETL